MPRGSVWFYLVAVTIVALGCDDKPIPGAPRSGSPLVAAAEKASGDAQTATVNSPVPVQPSIRVTGPVGQPIEGIPVKFSIVLGAGAITGADDTTDQNGVATLGSWVLGTRSGVNSLRVTVADTLLLGFSATGTPTAPASLTAVTASPIDGVVGTPLAVHPTVRIADAYGNPVSGISVTFQVTSGGGWASNLTDTTNALGLAATGTWTLGNISGDNTMQAMAIGLTPVAFLAKGSAAAPHSMTKVSGDSQHAGLRSAVSSSPAVAVRDSYGNAVSGVTVRFAVTSGGGTIGDSLRPTDSTGTARVGTWTLGSTPGPNTLTASVTGSPSVTFLANAVDMCADTTAYTLGTTVYDSLTTSSCIANARGEYTNRYTLTSGSRASLAFTMSAATYSTQVTLYDSTGIPIATTPDYCPGTYYCSGTNSLHVLLNAGSYVARAGGITYDYDDDAVGGVTGPYQFSSGTIPEDVNGCTNPVAFITPGITTAQRVDSTDCWMPFRSYRFYFDQFYVYMTPGLTYTISMMSADFDTYLELAYNPSGGYSNTVAYNDDADGSSNSVITFTPTTPGVYIIDAETYDPSTTGAYSLSVSVTGVASTAKPSPAMAPPPRTAQRPMPTFTPRPPKPQ